LAIGDSCWIGEDAWILNLGHICIGHVTQREQDRLAGVFHVPVEFETNICISQDALLCIRSHDRFSGTSEFDNDEIAVDEGAWIACRSTVREVKVGRGATVGAGTIVSRSIESGLVVFAPPAVQR
jgi:putative colanic acid biosynthesis acetyltransferase WcaF